MAPYSARVRTKPRSSSPEPTPGASSSDARFAAGLAILAALVAVTAAGGVAVARPGTPAGESKAKSLPPPALATAAPNDPRADVPFARAAVRAPALVRFQSALDALGRHERRESVRALWLGDSHTAADYMTGAVRSVLAARYGNGGPGFVRLGVGSYRHDWVTLNRIGAFRVEPEPPSRRAPQGDGVFGLGGMRASAVPQARLTVHLHPGAVVGRARYTLLFDLPHPSSFSVELGARRLVVDERTPVEHALGSTIARLTVEGEPSELLSIEIEHGKPRFYGVLIEGSEPGFVLDTLGIDGARVATPLAWADAPFVAEIAARHPDLVVLAYGTNEAFDASSVGAYDAQLAALLDRLRRGAPDADCLVLGPPDALSKSGEPAPRIPAIADVYRRTAAMNGCAFVSLQDRMGGPGTFMSWLRHDPRLSNPDRIHFTPKGYQRLGELVSEAVFGEGSAGSVFAAKTSP